MRNTMSTVFPAYTVVYPEVGSDRQAFTPKRSWPDVTRQQLTVKFDHGQSLTIVFDESNRASDVQHEMTVQARQKIRSRRLTPKSTTLPSEA